MGLSIWHILVVLVVVVILFGAGKLPRVLGDLGKGIKNFKEGIKDEDKDAAATPPKPVEQDKDAGPKA